jgi:hypothetical protein
MGSRLDPNLDVEAALVDLKETLQADFNLTLPAC